MRMRIKEIKNMNRKGKKDYLSSLGESSDVLRKVGACLVGMVAVTRADVIFKDQRVVGKFVGEKLEVRSVKVTRSGMVITVTRKGVGYISFLAIYCITQFVSG